MVVLVDHGGHACGDQAENAASELVYEGAVLSYGSKTFDYGHQLLIGGSAASSLFLPRDEDPPSPWTTLRAACAREGPPP